MGMLGIIREVGWIGKRERRKVGMITDWLQRREDDLEDADLYLSTGRMMVLSQKLVINTLGFRLVFTIA
jgi:hypothetical protein